MCVCGVTVRRCVCIDCEKVHVCGVTVRKCACVWCDCEEVCVCVWCEVL